MNHYNLVKTNVVTGEEKTYVQSFRGITFTEAKDMLNLIVEPECSYHLNQVDSNGDNIPFGDFVHIPADDCFLYPELTEEQVESTPPTVADIVHNLTIPNEIIAQSTTDDTKLMFGEEVNRLVLEGIPFRDAYKILGMQIAQSTADDTKLMFGEEAVAMLVEQALNIRESFISGSTEAADDAHLTVIESRGNGVTVEFENKAYNITIESLK